MTPSGVRRTGYIATIAIAAGLLYLINSLLSWDDVPFLTEDIEQIIPIINAALVAGMVVNAIWILYDAAWIRSIGQIILNISVIGAAALMLNVFPFNFAAYSFNWEAVATFALVFLILGLAIATLIEIIKFGGLIVND